MEYINLLIQIPLVGIFVWFVITMTRQTTEFITKRDEQWQGFLTEMRDSIENLARQVTLNTAIILLVYRKSGDPDHVTQELIAEVMDEYQRGQKRTEGTDRR